MTFPPDRPGANPFRHLRTVAPRLRVLVRVHLVASMAPVAEFLIWDTWFRSPLGTGPSPSSVQLLLSLAVQSVFYAQLLLLPFWAGLGTSAGIVRLVGGLLGSAYVAVWPVVALGLKPGLPRTTATELIGRYLVYFSLCCTVTALVAGVLLLNRRWFTELRHISDPKTLLPRAHFRYSILHLLVITTVFALFCGSMRVIVSGGPGSAVGWQFVALAVVGIVICLTVLACASWAVLGAGHVGRRVLVVLLATMLLGIVMASFSSKSVAAWVLYVNGVLGLVLPTAIVIVSLLIVRTCGYRLVGKGTVPS